MKPPDLRKKVGRGGALAVSFLFSTCLFAQASTRVALTYRVQIPAATSGTAATDVSFSGLLFLNYDRTVSETSGAGSSARTQSAFGKWASKQVSWGQDVPTDCDMRIKTLTVITADDGRNFFKTEVFSLKNGMKDAFVGTYSAVLRDAAGAEVTSQAGTVEGARIVLDAVK